MLESRTLEAKASVCACFGELGLNNEAKASRFEPNLSLSTPTEYRSLVFIRDSTPVEYWSFIIIHDSTPVEYRSLETSSRDLES